MNAFPVRPCIRLLVSHNTRKYTVTLRPLTNANGCHNLFFHRNVLLNQACARSYSNGMSSKDESVNVGHSSFLAEAQKRDSWEAQVRDLKKSDDSELKGVRPGKGKLQPTSSHLFKLVLPLAKTRPPTVFLLHPSQPLSHLARLISSALPKLPNNIYFCSAPDVEGEETKHIEDSNYAVPELGGELQWSDSTDIGDFTKAAARSRYFHIVIEKEEDDTKAKEGSNKRIIIEVTVPTFEQRTYYLQRRLDWVGQRRQELNTIKASCDDEARRATKRLAFAGLGVMVAYWVTILRLTFWDYGWNVIEPVSYLSGLSMIILGYSWFLYQGREVSYSSVMNSSISRRRYQLYESKGFDLDRWTDLVTEEKMIKKEISKIAMDYGLEWGDSETKKELKREAEKERKADEIESEEDGDDNESEPRKDKK